MVALRLPVPLNKEPRVQMPGGGRSLAPPVPADAVCCLSARRRRRPTLNNLEFVMCDEEELWSPSGRRGRRATEPPQEVERSIWTRTAVPVSSPGSGDANADDANTEEMQTKRGNA